MKLSKLRAILLMFTVLNLFGCMTTKNGNHVDNAFPPQETFRDKTVAILPVKSQTSLSTDSHTPLKKSLNGKIVAAVKTKLPGVTVITPQSSLDTLNEAGKLEVLKKMLSGYDNTGVFDKKLASAICSALKTDYLLLPKLKIEQMDAVVAKTFISSLEVFLLGRNSGEPLWNGIGDFKRYGVYGFGGTETEKAAKELVSLTFGGN